MNILTVLLIVFLCAALFLLAFWFAWSACVRGKAADKIQNDYYKEKTK